MTYAPPALRTVAEMDKIGNNPIVLQILAAVGAEMGEDTRLHGEGGQGDDVQKLMNSEPYWNKKHPEHASTVKRVNEFFARGGKVAARGVTNKGLGHPATARGRSTEGRTPRKRARKCISSTVVNGCRRARMCGHPDRVERSTERPEGRRQLNSTGDAHEGIQGSGRALAWRW
jgi:hypothetical protein